MRMTAKSAVLHKILSEDTCHPMPCCWDALSAKMIAQAGFDFTFMSGFAVSAARLGLPDLGLISYGEMLDQGRNICAAVDIPVLGDGDTGYGNALNVERTVRGYQRAGFACVMIEDQIAPKRCGHTRGKQVTGRSEALERISAAIHAKRQSGNDILIMARTDARAQYGLDEAIWRANEFARLGADIIFVEAPQSVEEMARITTEVPGVHMANMVEGGKTPILPPEKLHELGYSLAAYPLTLLSAAMKAIEASLADIKNGEHPYNRLMDFARIRRIIGFDDYYEAEQRYDASKRDDNQPNDR